MSRVLVAEDDPVLVRAYRRRLQRAGHAVDVAVTLAEARAWLIDVDYDCLVLDRLVPDGDTIDLVEELRGAGASTPILFLSALGGAEDRIEGLRAGAEDYLAKPVHLAELEVRVAILARRVSRPTVPPVLHLGRVTVDVAREEVCVDGCPVRLTPRQYAVLAHLAVHADRAVPTEELLDHCWDANRDPFSNPLHSQISRLRSIFRGVLEVPMVNGHSYQLQPVEAGEP